MQKRLEEGALQNTAVICFHNPNYTTLPYENNCSACLSVAVYDIDLEVLPEYGLTFETYLPEAKDIAAFIKSAVAKNWDIICQCEYGQSRSAACAAAIREFYDGDGICVFADYRYYPNQLIFNKVLDALRSQ